MRRDEFQYPQIDLKKTGEWIRILCKHYGYSVKDIQDNLHISSNQAIYEWFNGHTLPSINNLLALSMLFNISMNSLLVDNVHEIVTVENRARLETQKRSIKYCITTSQNVIRM